MSNQRIVYLNDAGNVSVVIPAPEALARHGIQAIARKDVPAGKQYRIVLASAIPARAGRAAWYAALNAPFDGVGSTSDEFDPV